MVDGVLTFLRRDVQNLHVHFVSNLFRMSGSQRVPGQTKTAGGKHFFAIPIVGERPRFPHKRIDDMPVIDGRQLLSNEPWHGLNDMSVMRYGDLFGGDSQIHQLPDQPAGNRIRIRPHDDRAAATDADTFNYVIRIQPFIG